LPVNSCLYISANDFSDAAGAAISSLVCMQSVMVSIW
jgi:hypothetical protein